MSQPSAASIVSLRPRAVLLAVLCTLLWGSAIPIVKISSPLFGITTAFDRILFAGVRFTAAGLVTLLVARFLAPARAPLSLRHRLRCWTRAGANNGAIVCFDLGLRMRSARAAPFSYDVTCFTVFLAACSSPPSA